MKKTESLGKNLTKTRKISFKGEQGKKAYNVLSRLPKGKVSEFVVSAVIEKIINEIERLKSSIVFWQKEITKERKALSKSDDPVYQENIKRWIEEYKQNIRNIRTELHTYSIFFDS